MHEHTKLFKNECTSLQDGGLDSKMKALSLFDECVSLALTDAADGNMKLTSAMDALSKAQTRSNRAAILEALGLSNSSSALVKVSYEKDDFCDFRTLHAAEEFALSNDVHVPPSDGILTHTAGLGIFLPLADCLGVVLFDPEQRALMVVHCGRHTLLQSGACKAVEFMKETAHSQPKDILVWFSPSAGKDNYPLYDADNKGLQEFAIEQLIEAGVLPRSLQPSSIDTTLSPEYFSHSRGDTEDRFAICASITA